jgi:hypothetical protein
VLGTTLQHDEAHRLSVQDGCNDLTRLYVAVKWTVHASRTLYFSLGSTLNTVFREPCLSACLSRMELFRNLVMGAVCMLVMVPKNERYFNETLNYFCNCNLFLHCCLCCFVRMDIDMMQAGMDVQADWDLMDIDDPEMPEDELEKELALLQDAVVVPAEAAVAAPGAHLMPVNEPAVAIAAADAAADAANLQQQHLPVNNEEAAAAVQQRLAEFDRGITVARVAVQTARRLYNKLVGSMFTPVEKDTIIQCINSVEMYISTYADSMRGRQFEFEFAPTRAGAVLSEVTNALGHFQQKLQHMVASNAMDLHASVRLRCVMSYLQHIHAAFQPAELPARQQRLQHACDHQDAIRQAAPPVSRSHLHSFAYCWVYIVRQ